MKDSCGIEPVIIEHATERYKQTGDVLDAFVVAVAGSVFGYTITGDIDSITYGAMVFLVPPIVKGVVDYFKKPQRPLDSIFDDY